MSDKPKGEKKFDVDEDLSQVEIPEILPVLPLRGIVIFPSQISWTLDGRPLADLKVTAFKSNPYVVFPVPAVVRQTVSK